jgi:hypothetical protein
MCAINVSGGDLAGIGGLLLYRTWAMLIFAVMMFGLVARSP